MQKLVLRNRRKKRLSLKEKKKFAQDLLKKNKSIKTVLEKSGKVKGRLRKPELKYLAGEKTREVLYKENDCVFRFNIDKTYFSPRLSNERKEIASKIKEGNVVLVMFAGVAPFSIVIAKNSKAEKIYSNEINREANKYSELNIELNKVKNKVELVPGDIKRVAEKLKNYVRFPSKELKKSPHRNRREIPKNRLGSFGFDVIVMPRPQLNETFLEQAFKLSKRGTRIFYYDFCGIDEIDEVVDRIKKEASRAKIRIKILKTKKAGEIAPYKIRVRIELEVL